MQLTSSEALTRAIASFQAGHLDQAEALCRAILRADASHLIALHLLATVQSQLGRLQDALASYDKVLAIKPDYPEALNNRGTVLEDLSRFEEALASYDKALAIKRDYVEALNNRGIALHDLNRFEEALASYDKALAIKRDYVEVLFNRGNALLELKRTEEALASYDKALAIKPDYADGLFNRALSKLLIGRYREGWADYEGRWETKDFTSRRPQINAPAWHDQDLAGRHLLVYTEQGLGDVIQFARYLPLLVERSARVTFLTASKLARLLRPLTAQIDVVSELGMTDAFDFQCALMSLPRWFNTDLSSIPNKVPYLTAEQNLSASWKERLDEGGFKIGIAWKGNPQRKYRDRWIPLEEFIPLTRVPSVRLISLQKHHGLDQLARLPADVKIETLADFDSGPDAFIDTAAVMSNLDLIITADTSIAHLAGALGHRTWVALNYVPDWRWMLDRADSPWYPTIRLFRQQDRDDWKPVFRMIENELISLLGHPGRIFGQG